MSKGDKHNIKCPKCRKHIVNILGGHSEPLPGKMGEFLRNCPQCGVQIRVWCQWTLTVQVEQESKVK
jgi:endogenous inhibitor of DNA gyrase (YacG/DUF329 family)